MTWLAAAIAFWAIVWFDNESRRRAYSRWSRELEDKMNRDNLEHDRAKHEAGERLHREQFEYQKHKDDLERKRWEERSKR